MSIPLTPELLELIAERFKALAEPARLNILNALRDGEKTVSALLDETGLGQANVSKHLQLLHGLGFVDPEEGGALRLLPARRRERLSALRHHVRPS